MANKRITELTDIGTPASSDVLEIVDVSDTTDSPEGTSKKVLVSALGSSTTPNLEQVLTEGETATDLGITLNNTLDNTFIGLDPFDGSVGVIDPVADEFLKIKKDLIKRAKAGFETDLTFTDPTANRTINFKDESGTVALLSDITGVSDGDKGDITVSSSGSVWTIDNGAVTLAKTSGLQETLVSGTNIKTINGTSILGSGDIPISGAGATQNARATRLELTSDINLPISATGSVSVIDFDNSVFNVDPTVFTNNGAGTITCTLAGNYLVTTSVVIESPLASAITKTELGIRKNGTNVVCATTDDTPIALGNNVRSLTTSTIINLAANDTLQAIINLYGASATGRALRLPALFGTTATQVSNISIERLEVSEFDVDAVPTDGSTNAVSSNGVFDALALKQDKVTGVSDTEIGYLDGVTGAIQTQLNDKSTKIIKAGYTSLTGVTGQSVISSLLIPANWLASGDGFEIIATPIKSTTVSAMNFNLYHDTTINGLTNGIATGISLTTVQRGSYIQRILSLSGTTLYNIMAVITTSAIPTTGSSVGATTTFNPAVDNYITITANPTVGTETFGFHQFFLRKL